jgi:transposase
MNVHHHRMPERVQHVITLRHQGMSRRAIARALKMSPNTVRKILVQHQVKRQQPHHAIQPPPQRAARPSKLDPFKLEIDRLLVTYPDITAQRIFEELQLKKFDGSYTIVKDWVRRVRPKPKPKVSLPTVEYGPGQMAESDWSPYTIHIQGICNRSCTA